MKIRSFRNLLNHVYRITVLTEDWSQDDVRLMSEFGEPEIDLGGSFAAIPTTGGNSATDTFTLPARYARISTDLHKMVQEFDYRDSNNSKNRALAWETEIVSRLSAAVTGMRSSFEAESFEAETVTNIVEAQSFTAETVAQI